MPETRKKHQRSELEKSPLRTDSAVSAALGRVRRQSAKNPGAATLLDASGITGTAMIHRLAPETPSPAPVAETFPAGCRRLHDLPRGVQRPLESRLYHLRRVYNKSDAEISHLLDLHPADLDALAATSGNK